MSWYYEILGEDDEVVETSEPVYATMIEPCAGYGIAGAEIIRHDFHKRRAPRH